MHDWACGCRLHESCIRRKHQRPAPTTVLSVYKPESGKRRGESKSSKPMMTAMLANTSFRVVDFPTRLYIATQNIRATNDQYNACPVIIVYSFPESLRRIGVFCRMSMMSFTKLSVALALFMLRYRSWNFF